MDNVLPIFKKWVPEWLIKVILFSILLPSTVLFFLPLSNINAAAGYYGCEPADIQFSVALFYSGYVGFYSLERRFFIYLATKEYFILFTFLQIMLTLVCCYTQSLQVFFPVRFIQGMLFSSTVNLSLSLMFTHLRSERAREISFSVFFGMLLCAIPFNNFVTAGFIDSFNFDVVYKCAMFSYIPGLFMLLISMNNIRLNVQFPLYKLDWQSFSIYSIVLCLIGYISIYGQEYYWLNDRRIRNSVIAIVGLCLVYIIRERRMKRPYILLTIFKFRNFNIGLLILFIMYICRFSSGITNAYFSSVLKFDPMHVSYINLLNLAGLVVGVVISCSMILVKKHIRFVWLPGFLLLLAFHIIMFFLFDIQGNENNYFLPLFIQGLGVGMIMVPTIIYAIASVPVSMGPSASAICLAVRYFGFCGSIAIMNYFELFSKSRHYNAFQDHLTKINPGIQQMMQSRTGELLSNGIKQSQSVNASKKLLINAVNTQSQLRFAMDYYEIIAWLIIVTLLFISLFPYLNRTIIYLRSSKLAPA